MIERIIVGMANIEPNITLIGNPIHAVEGPKYAGLD
jgi:hypothetical protein